ncbi:hypothetical protein I4U23_026393 [Adineta vaga]|nr:hypothetical protein I4U23_026393 [Adineta vaga]
MIEEITNKSFSCKLCTNETKQNLCIANCIGCKDLFCYEHLIQHRKQSINHLEEVIQRHATINDNTFAQLNINQHFEYIDRWEIETIDLIHKHTKDVKEKLRIIFQTYKLELQQFHVMLGEELEHQRNLKICIEQNLKICIEQNLNNLSQQIEQLYKEIQQMNKVIYHMSNKELYQIIDKFNLSTSTLGKPVQWTYLHEIKLDSTYGYMAANNEQIFLGWKNRIVIYNLNGTKHDETRLQSTEIYGELCDIIWSTSMQRFFILCQKSLFIHYPSSRQVEIIGNISLINQDNEYTSITTFDNKLILLTKQCLEIWHLNNDTFHLSNSILISIILKNPCEESICCIRTNNQHLAILIQNEQTHTWRLDLFNFHPFSRLHIGTAFDRYKQTNLGLLTTFCDKIYLFMNWETKLMRLIDQNGLNELIDFNAYNACLVGTQRMIVVNYMTYLKIYAF